MSNELCSSSTFPARLVRLLEQSDPSVRRQKSASSEIYLDRFSLNSLRRARFSIQASMRPAKSAMKVDLFSRSLRSRHRLISECLRALGSCGVCLRRLRRGGRGGGERRLRLAGPPRPPLSQPLADIIGRFRGAWSAG